MFGEIIKLLADEPEKIEKAIFRAIKVVFSIIIAERLFRFIAGPYLFLELDSYTDWLHFILSGRLLICLFFYFIGSYIIIPFIHFLGNLLTHLVTKIEVKLDTGDFRRIFKLLDIVRYHGKHEVPIPGKNISLLYDLSEAMSDEGAKEEIDSLKDTFIGNVLNVYSVFLLVYFMFTESVFRSPLLDWLVVAGYLAAVLLYAVLHGFFEYMQANYQLLISSLSFVKAYHSIRMTFASFGIFPAFGGKGTGLGRYKLFDYKGMKYVLVVVPPLLKNLNTQQDWVTLLTSRASEGRRLIVIRQVGNLPAAEPLLLQYPDRLFLVEYTDENNLEHQLRQTVERL